MMATAKKIMGDEQYLAYAIMDEISIVIPNPEHFLRQHEYQDHDEVIGFFAQKFAEKFPYADFAGKDDSAEPVRFHFRAYNLAEQTDDAIVRFLIWRENRVYPGIVMYIAKDSFMSEVRKELANTGFKTMIELMNELKITSEYKIPSSFLDGILHDTTGEIAERIKQHKSQYPAYYSTHRLNYGNFE